MSKLHLLIADNDVDYVNSVVSFLTSAYAGRFILSSFTEEQPFVNFLGRNKSTKECKLDILLLGSGFDAGSYQAFNGGVVIILEEKYDQIKNQNKGEKKKIFKYQRGDVLVSQALQIFADISPEACGLCSGGQTTRVIAICSPDGGVGKTTAAIGMSVQAAWEGKKVFYLNLEFLPSTELFFSGEQEQNLSNVIYYLKNNRKNLSMKLDGAKCVDPWYRIDYFKEPDSVLDLKEDIAQELRTLVRQLVLTGSYDRIYIDMSASLEQNYLAVLEICDDILVLFTQDVISVEKTKKLIKEFELLERGKDLALLEKVSLIINKYENIGSDSAETKICGKNIAHKIPRVTGLMLPHGTKYRLDMNSAFGTAVHELAARF